MHQNKKGLYIWIVVFLLFIGSGITLLIPTDYYTMRPGSAVNVRKFIEIEKHRYPEGGDFLLTTVTIKPGTVFDLLASRVTDSIELFEKKEVLGTQETPEKYKLRQQEYMHHSQQSATIAAFQYAKMPVNLQAEGVGVFQVERKDSILREGDIIRKVGGKDILTVEDLQLYLSKKKVGDKVGIEFLRGKKVHKEKMTLIQLSSTQEDKKRAGLGIIPLTKSKLTTTPSVFIETKDIGGPSAGLMFALEVLNQLIPEDLTKGYTIAGTGTISSDGSIGQIGGISHKIVAAHRARAQFFFCPKDQRDGDENEKSARRKIQEMNIKMKLVPVANVGEAVDFLKKVKRP